MKAIVLGAGKVGKVIAQDLVNSNLFEEVAIADIFDKTLDDAKKFINDPRLKTKKVDARNYEEIVEAMKGYDIGAGALWHHIALNGIKAAIEVGIDYVDLVGSYPEKRLALNDEAKNKNVTIIPGCGVAPGLGNIQIGYGATLFDELENGVIYVGGLPLNKEDSPLEYKIVYAIQSVFSYLDDPSRVMINDEIVNEETFGNLELIEFPEPLGTCEAYLTDGLSYLMYTMKGKGFKRLEEKTVRYPGYADKVKFLMKCGAFDEEPVEIDGKKVVPKDVFLKSLEPRIALGDDVDITIMRVQVSGKREGKKQMVIFDLLDFRDKETGMTSMAKTTAYPCAIAAEMIARNEITEKGVLPPEIVFETQQRYTKLEDELKKRGIKISQKIVDMETK